MYRVFHGIRFKVKKIGCRDDNQFFYPYTPRLCRVFRVAVRSMTDSLEKVSFSTGYSLEKM